MAATPGADIEAIAAWITAAAKERTAWHRHGLRAFDADKDARAG